MDRLRRSSDRSQACRLLISVAFAVSLAVSPALAFTPSGLLEIHQINIQQGDCTLIIGPDGTRVLLDAGRNGKGTDEVVPYLQSLGIMPADGLDYMIATHHDADHVGGLDDVINAGYDVLNNVWDNGSTYTTQTVTDFLNAAATTTAGAVTQMPLGTVIQLGDGATARCVAVHGDVLGYGSVSGATANENDMCVAILVQYKDFDYITAGDLGGGQWTADNTCTGRTTGQVNVESPLVTSLMPGGGAALLTSDGVEVLDVNHHGSESSTNSEWMNMLTPSVALINVGAGQGSNYHHPRKDVVENVLQAGGACITAPPALVLQTEEGSPVGANTSFAGFCAGDLIVKTTGIGTYEVSGTGEVSQGPDERVAAGIGSPTNFPMDAAGGSGDTEAPLVTVFAPDGGETWDAGTVHAITWTATDNVGVTSIDVLYSVNGAGGPYTSIASGEANDGTYDWTVANAPSTNAYVKVIAHDAGGNSGEDVSNGAFTIQGSGGTPLLVINEIMQNPNAVTDANGEWFELYNPGTAVDINGWTIRDDGSDSHVINNGGPLVVPAGGYLVLGRNGSTGSNGGYTADYVYSSFTLANSADEVVLVDDLGTEIDRVNYSGSPWPVPTGTSMELIDAGADNNVASNWAEAIARGGTFTGGGDLGTPGAANSVSSGPDVTPPVAAVVSPNGAESWDTGTVHAITWTATDDVGVTSIDLLVSTGGAGGPFTSIATGEANDGTYDWTVPATPSTNAYVKVIAYDAASNSGEDVSDAAFTIHDGTAPVATVSSPNGGEALGIGTVAAITWSASDNVGVTSIDLSYSTNGAGGPFTSIATGEANDGTYDWTVPNDPSANAYVKVTAYDAASNSGEDVSNAAFSIDDVTAPTVAVSAPNGGETWDVGSVYAITWNASDNLGVTSIDLLYSTSGSGGPFTSIATGEANDGTYDWTVPDDPSGNAYVKVVAYDAASNSGEDVSNGAFTIQSPGPTPVLVINEIMANPLSVGDTEGEWFEIYNPGASAIDINGWTIRDDGSDSHVINNGGPLDVPAGGYLVLGRNGDPGVNGGYTADYVYSSFLLANAADEIYLVDDQGVTVDAVLYTNTSPWPNPDGASIELSDPGLDNNDGSNWALATARGGTFDGSGSDLGTPGAANGGGATSQLHVHGLIVDNVPANGGRWSGLATITVHDQNHNPVSGVTVTGDWSGNTSETGVTGVTDGSGVATIESKKVKHPSTTFCFDVTDLSASGYTYDVGSDSPQTPPAVCGPGLQSSVDVPVAFDLRVIDGNPFRFRTSVKFSVPAQSRIEMSLFDVQGRRVATLVDGVYPAGQHIQEWYGRDDQGRPVPSGVYLVMMNNDQGLRLVQRLAVVR